MVEERTEKLEDIQKKLINKEKLSILGKLSGSIGHELRNPLGIIANSIYFLNMKLNDKDKDEKVIKHLGFLQREVENADRLISELLTYSEEKTSYFTDTNVNELINSTISEIRIPKHIELKLNFNEDIGLVQVDPEQMVEVFKKIISNAINALQEKGKLEIVTDSNDKFIEINFIDNGIGISKINQKKIFEPLFTTGNAGIGLGLPIVKSIIDKHNGEIDVKSELGKGTIFTIKLKK